MFNFFKKQKRSLENPSVPLTSDAAYELLAGSRGSVVVNEMTALSNPPMWRGVSLIANAVGNLPLDVFVKKEDDSRERATKHPAYYVLKTKPSGLYTPFHWKQTTVAQAILYGNSYSLIIRNDAGNVQELLLLDPSQTTVEYKNSLLTYITRIDNLEYRFDSSDVFHLKGLGDGICGYPLVQIMRQALGLGLAMQNYGTKFFENQARPSLVIELPPGVKDQNMIDDFKARWNAAHSGRGIHSSAFLPNGSNITPIIGSNNEAQFIESRMFDLILIADILSIPASFLGAANTTSYGSLEMEQLNFLSQTLNPWLTAFEEQCNAKLLSSRQLDYGTHYCEFNRRAYIQIDTKTQHEITVSGVNNGMYSWEEGRVFNNMPTKKDKKQEWRLPSNVIIEGEEPPAPAPVPEAGPDTTDAPQAKPEPSKSKSGDKARAVTKVVLERMASRLAKSKDLASNRAVLLENLQPFENREAVVDGWLDELQAELEFCLPEQKQSVIENYNLDKLVDALWNEDL